MWLRSVQSRAVRYTFHRQMLPMILSLQQSRGKDTMAVRLPTFTASKSHHLIRYWVHCAILSSPLCSFTDCSKFEEKGYEQTWLGSRQRGGSRW